MQKWEYKITEQLKEAAMNQLGADGWELVATITDKDGWWEGCIFKRPKS